MVMTATLIKNQREGTVTSRPLAQIISDLPEGKYRIIIEPQTVRHSVPQHKLLFMWLSLIAKRTGHSKGEVYRYYCHKFLADDMPSVSEMSNYQLTDFMHHIEAEASEMGWHLPVPDDGDSFIEFYMEFKDR